ncbi:hypothetical protein PG991_015206 [Apiospora marii]|uniref:F-box domain-containing protein n=1 Tax=Apiospora marii TaxID=335849 RepID=A0ABR1R3L8_9PEZI
MVPTSSNIPDITWPEPCLSQGLLNLLPSLTTHHRKAPTLAREDFHQYQSLVLLSACCRGRHSRRRTSTFIFIIFTPVVAASGDGHYHNYYTTVPTAQDTAPEQAPWLLVPAVAADGFQGWKQIDVRGRQASRSFGDLQALRIAWSAPPVTNKPTPTKVPGRPTAGPIIDLLVLDVPSQWHLCSQCGLDVTAVGFQDLYTATLHALYRKITIPIRGLFRKFLAHVSQNQELGTITLLQCLEYTPYLREFLAQEHIDDEINEDVLRKLFLDLPRLQAVDFTGCSSNNFKAAMSAIPKFELPVSLAITRLSLHKCINLPSAVFESLMPTLATQRTWTLPAPASQMKPLLCTVESRGGVGVSGHTPRSQWLLVFLSVASDARSHQLLDVEDVTRLLPILPSTLRLLSLKGSKMDDSHIDLLRPLTKHLEELALVGLEKLTDIDRLFVPDENDDDVQIATRLVPHTLKYL